MQSIQCAFNSFLKNLQALGQVKIKGKVLDNTLFLKKSNVFEWFSGGIKNGHVYTINVLFSFSLSMLTSSFPCRSFQ